MLSIIWILLGVFILAMYSGLLLLDDKTPESDLKNKEIENDWHVVGALFFIYFSISTGIFLGFKYIPFVLSCFWFLFAGIVHVIGLDKPFFYVGNVAKTDILIKKIFVKNPNRGSMIIKVTALLLSIVLILFL